MATFTTNYYNAVHWLHNNLILCNEIAELDPSLIENAQWDWWDTDDTYFEIYQYYITDCTSEDVEFLTNHFDGLLFAFSPMLGKYILCVDHYGTSWDYVSVDTDLEYFDGMNEHERIR